MYEASTKDAIAGNSPDGYISPRRLGEALAAQTFAAETFDVTGRLTKAIAATGSVVFAGGVPTDGQIITLDDGVNDPVVFEFDDGAAATGVITLTGVPADTGTVSISDGTTSKVLEFDNGVAGVASTGGIITFSGVPADGNTVVLTTAAGVVTTFEFNTGGGVTSGNKPVFTGADAAGAATELIAAINGTGVYTGNGDTGYTASSGGSGVVNIVRTAAGAGNQTITKSGSNITVTASFSGGVTAVAAGSAVTGGRLGIVTGAAGVTTLTAAQVCTNIINAINAVTGPAFLFTATQGAGTTVVLTANAKGTAGNAFTITESASNLTVSGSGNFTGGAAAGSGAVTGSNVAVAIGATAALTATALYNAINSASSLDITANNGTAGTVGLTNDTKGAAGNVTITENASNVTVTGMSGGVDTESDDLLTAAEVGTTRKFHLDGFALLVNGATAWNDATSVSLKDTADSPVTFATILKAALAGSAFVVPTAANIGAGMVNGGTLGKGLRFAASGNESTGSDVVIRVWGRISVPA